MSETLRTLGDTSDGLLDFHPNVLSNLLSPKVMDLELGDREAVCGRCHLVYVTAGPCRNCEE